MSKFLKRIGTKQVKYFVEFILDNFTINLKYSKKLEIKAILKLGKNEQSTYQKVYLDSKKCIFYNQKLSILSTFYLSEKNNKFQQKLACLEILIISSQSQKLAGKLQIDIAKYINSGIQQKQLISKLEKCPDKNALIQFELLIYQQGTKIQQQKQPKQNILLEQHDNDQQEQKQIHKSITNCKRYDEQYEEEKKEQQQYQQQEKCKEYRNQYNTSIVKQVEEYENMQQIKTFSDQEEQTEKFNDLVEIGKQYQRQKIEEINKQYRNNYKNQQKNELYSINNLSNNDKLFSITETKSDMEISKGGSLVNTFVSGNSVRNKSIKDQQQQCIKCLLLQKQTEQQQDKIKHLEQLISILQSNSEENKIHLHYQQQIENWEQKYKNQEQQIQQLKQHSDIDHLETINQKLKQSTLQSQQIHNNSSSNPQQQQLQVGIKEQDIVMGKEERLVEKKMDILQGEIERKDKELIIYKQLIDQMKQERYNNENYQQEDDQVQNNWKDKYLNQVDDLKLENYNLKKKLKKIEMGLNDQEDLSDSMIKKLGLNGNESYKMKKEQIIKELENRNQKLNQDIKELEQKNKQQQYIQFFVQEKESKMKNEQLDKQNEKLEKQHKNLIENKLMQEKINYQKQSMQIQINNLQDENKYLYDIVKNLQQQVVEAKEELGIIMNAAFETGDNYICSVIERDLRFKKQQQQSILQNNSNDSLLEEEDLNKQQQQQQQQQQDSFVQDYNLNQQQNLYNEIENNNNVSIQQQQINTISYDQENENKNKEYEVIEYQLQDSNV